MAGCALRAKTNPPYGSPRSRLAGRLGRPALRLAHLALELLAAFRQPFVLGLHQERIEPTVVLYRTQSMGAYTQPHPALQRVADERHVHEIRLDHARGLVLGMAAQLAGHRPLAGELGTACHLSCVLGKCAFLARGLCCRRSIQDASHVKALWVVRAA